MLRFLSNAHTHTRWCDGANSVREMVEAAQKLGFVSLGFSGHGCERLRPGWCMSPSQQDAYREEILALREELQSVKGAPRLWLGVEQDSLTEEPRKRQYCDEFEYRIGSAHCLTDDYHGQCVTVDGDPELLKQYVDEAFDGDMLAMVQAYYQSEAEHLLRDRPEIIGHFDLVCKNAESLNWFDISDPAYRRMALEALERAYPCGAVLEVNTGGMARGYYPRPYPTEELLCAWREMGGEVTITSDCHNAEYLQYGFDAALAMLKRLGYQRVRRLGTGRALWEEEKL